MLDACTRCGKCVEVCPERQRPPASPMPARADVISRRARHRAHRHRSSEASRKWATSCMLSGRMHQGVRLRRQSALFARHGARLPCAKAENELRERRRQGVEKFRDLSRGRDACCRACNSMTRSAGAARPEIGVGIRGRTSRRTSCSYTGCNVLKTPHIALLALDIMDTLGVTYRVMGGPTPLLRRHSTAHRRHRDVSGAWAASTLDKLAAEQDQAVISWCPSCLRPVHGDNDTYDRESEAVAAVRDDALHAASC